MLITHIAEYKVYAKYKILAWLWIKFCWQLNKKNLKYFLQNVASVCAYTRPWGKRVHTSRANQVVLGAKDTTYGLVLNAIFTRFSDQKYRSLQELEAAWLNSIVRKINSWPFTVLSHFTLGFFLFIIIVEVLYREYCIVQLFGMRLCLLSGNRE